MDHPSHNKLFYNKYRFRIAPFASQSKYLKVEKIYSKFLINTNTFSGVKIKAKITENHASVK